MAPPTILIREFNTKAVSDWVPGEVVQTYEQLESTTFKLFEKNHHFWSVHFHLIDGACKGKISRQLWSSGVYFDAAPMPEGELEVLAHFEKATGSGVAAGSPTTSTKRSSSSAFDPISKDSDNEPENCAEKRQRTFTKTPEVKVETQNMIYISSDSESDAKPVIQEVNRAPKNEDQTTSKPVQKIVSAGIREKKHPVKYDPAIHGPLPNEISIDSWEIDFETELKKNAEPGIAYHANKRDDYEARKKKGCVHARLIEGKYGIDTPQSCNKCKLAGQSCRIYHPALYATRDGSWPRFGARCGRCRVVSKGRCGME